MDPLIKLVIERKQPGCLFGVTACCPQNRSPGRQPLTAHFQTHLVYKIFFLAITQSKLQKEKLTADLAPNLSQLNLSNFRSELQEAWQYYQQDFVLKPGTCASSFNGTFFRLKSFTTKVRNFWQYQICKKQRKLQNTFILYSNSLKYP